MQHGIQAQHQNIVKHRTAPIIHASGPGSDLIDVWIWLWQCGQVIVIGAFPYFILDWTITTCCAGCCTGCGTATYPGAGIGGAWPGTLGYIWPGGGGGYPAGGAEYPGPVPGYGGGASILVGGALASWVLSILYFVMRHV